MCKEKRINFLFLFLINNKILYKILCIQLMKNERPNIIKTTLIKGIYKLNFYLPLSISKIKKEIKHTSLYNKEKLLEKEKKLKKLNIELNTFSHTPIINKEIKSYSEDKEISKVINLFQKTKKKFKENEEKYKINEKEVHFDLNKLKKKVRKIIKSNEMKKKIKTKINNYNKDDFINSFQKKLILNKRNSNIIKEYLNLEKSKDEIHLEKKLLNIEYNHIMKKNDLISSASDFLNEKKQNKKILFQINSYNKTNNNYNSFNNKKLFEKRINLRKNKFNNKINYDNEEKKTFSQINSFESDLLERKNMTFLKRYKNCFEELKKEEKRHYNNHVFKKEQIKKIMSSRNSLYIDKLKYDYLFQIGEINSNKCLTTRIKLKNDKNLKSKNNSVLNKVNIALSNYESGIYEKSKYNIEDYIKI